MDKRFDLLLRVYISNHLYARNINNSVSVQDVLKDLILERTDSKALTQNNYMQ